MGATVYALMRETPAFAALSALWTQVFGQPPAIRASAEELADLLVRHLPKAEPYRLGKPSQSEPAAKVSVSKAKGRNPGDAS
ncbi:MAG: hypothetical protein ACYDD1_03850 [Caulobacteraceae bacterium]